MSSAERFFCVRVYANGDMKCSMRDREGRDSWVQYNKVFRFGNGLFVNGLCVAPGYLDSSQVQQVEAALSLRGIPDTKPVKIGPQVEVFAGTVDRYEGYPQDYQVPGLVWE